MSPRPSKSRKPSKPRKPSKSHRSSRSSPVPSVIDLAAAAIAEASLEGEDEDSDFHGQLAENQRRVIESVLLDPVTM